MTPTISPDTFNQFFAWAPFIVGALIYLVFYVAKRRECAAKPPAVAGSESFACAQCGRSGPRDQMVAQNYGGATGYVCAHCAASGAAVAH